VWHRCKFRLAVHFDHGVTGLLPRNSAFVGNKPGKVHYFNVGSSAPHNDRSTFSHESGKQLFSCLHDGLWPAWLTAFVGSASTRSPGTWQIRVAGTLSGSQCILIGEHEELHELSTLDLLQRFGLREVNRFEFPLVADDDDDADIVDAAIAAARFMNAEQILLALSWLDTRRRDLSVRMLRAQPLPVLLLPDRSVRQVFSQAGAESSSIELQRAPLSKLERAAKRALDLVSEGAGLLTLLPLLAVVSLMIKLDSAGPVIFRQTRRGFNGREFMIWKFRTMTMIENGKAICQAKRNDEGVTRIGRLLSATSTDELPQLLNVLRGEMSLVGPRPHALAHDDEYGKSIGKYAFRHHVKPGITGWAQVNGFRGGTPELDLMKERIDLDLWYIDNWSFWLDLWIIARTCFEVARGRNAY
jgi:exopolysaccharide biosynthesis polyprenyl glycosylphosphotransferase